MKLRTRIGIVAAVVAAVAAIAASPAGATTNGVEIWNYGVGKCLTVPNASTAFGTAILQEICDGRPGQHWYFQGTPGGIRQIVNAETGGCMLATEFYWANPNGFPDGAPVVQGSCGSGDPGVYWAFTDLPTGTPAVRHIIFHNYTYNVCLDLENGSSRSDVPMQVWTCNSHTNNQLWVVE